MECYENFRGVLKAQLMLYIVHHHKHGPLQKKVMPLARISKAFVQNTRMSLSIEPANQEAPRVKIHRSKRDATWSHRVREQISIPASGQCPQN